MALDWRAPRKSFDSFAFFPNAFRINWRRCPVILADEGNLFSALGILPTFINCVSMISETDFFKKGLYRLGPSIQHKWHRTKTKLAQSTRIAGLDFSLGHCVAKVGFLSALMMMCERIYDMKVLTINGTPRKLGGMMLWIINQTTFPRGAIQARMQLGFHSRR